MISLSISVFGFVQLPEAVKVVSLQLTNAFSQLLTANKNRFQPLAALQNLDPAANRKPNTCPPKNVKNGFLSINYFV